MRLEHGLRWPPTIPATQQQQLSKTKITYRQAVSELEHEVKLSTLREPILLTDVQVDGAGNPVARPTHSGAVLYAKLSCGTVKVFCCDRYYKVSDNVRQLALYVKHGRMLRSLPVRTVDGLTYLSSLKNQQACKS